MDLLFKRYASPFLLLNQAIDANGFSVFVTDFLILCADEYTERRNWEMYLHHETLSKSYNDFKYEIGMNMETTQKKAVASPDMLTAQIESTVNKSENLLMNFAVSE